MPKVNPTYITPLLGGTAEKSGGIAEKKGYYFLCYIPSISGSFIRETYPLPKAMDKNTEKGKQAIDLQEMNYLVYAWPIEYGKTGNKAFFISPTGMLETDNKILKYSGLNNIPDAIAALQKDGSVVVGKTLDGQTWSGDTYINWTVKERRESLKQDREKAALGDKNAMISLALRYEKGHGVEKDLQKTVEWYQKAADLGSKYAKEQLDGLKK